MNPTVKIFDTTLRDGEQSPGATMNTDEKVRIAQQLENRVARSAKQDVRHWPHVGEPQTVERIVHGDDYMVVVAVEHPRLLPIKPSLGGSVVAHRAGAVLTGVVPVPLPVPLRARLHMSTQRCCPAERDPLRRTPHVRRQ